MIYDIGKQNTKNITEYTQKSVIIFMGTHEGGKDRVLSPSPRDKKYYQLVAQ